MKMHRSHVAVSLAFVAGAAACGGDDDGDDDGASCDHLDLASAAESLTLPTGYPPASFLFLNSEANCGPAGTPTFYFTDLDGDDFGDLLVTASCGDATLGTTTWRVHRGARDGFAAATSWTLPAGYPAGSFLRAADVASCGPSGLPTFLLLDLVGDGALDLVIASQCGDAGVGTSRWRVHAGTGQGFAATATDFALPAGYPPNSFVTSGSVANCGAAGLPTYGLAELTGDGRLDLVVTAACGDTTLGTSSWRIHANGANGFGAATTYALPTGYPPNSFSALGALANCGAAGLPTYITTDVDGDERADVLVTAACGDSALGSSRWRIHSGGDGGFGAARDLTLPTGYPPSSFVLFSGAANCGASGLPTFASGAFVGDDRSDIMVTAACADGALGTSAWRVHGGTTDGFGAADPIPLPTGYPPNSFTGLLGFANCGPAGTPSYAFIDGDGDGRRDLVVTARCGDNEVGTSRWLIHRSRCAP